MGKKTKTSTGENLPVLLPKVLPEVGRPRSVSTYAWPADPTRVRESLAELGATADGLVVMEYERVDEQVTTERFWLPPFVSEVRVTTKRQRVRFGRPKS